MRRGVVTLAVAVLGLAAAASPARAAVTLTQVGTFALPVYVTAPPGDTANVMVVQQGGTVRILRDGVLLPKSFLDLRSRVLSGGERGLLSIAFAPDYSSSGLLYAYFTNKDGNIQIVKLRRSAANPDIVDPASLRTVASIFHPTYANHNGGQLQFGPDGRLYAGTGDGGGGGDPRGNAQNPNSLLGKILLVNPTTRRASRFALGLRNPWRFSFDRWNGDMVIADVGQGSVEEVDFAAAPGLGKDANYGWNRFEGNRLYNAATMIKGPVTAPVLTHLHGEGWCSITGGYIVRDLALHELFGKYVYGDFCKGDIYAVTLPDAKDDAPTGLHVSRLTSFGEDGCGRIYATSLGGPVYRLGSSGRCVPIRP